MKKTVIIERVLSVVTAIILLQTLFFKFTGAEESVYIFSKLNLEPMGRIVVGIAELIVGILLLFRKTSHYGSIMGMAILSGALFFHLTILGVEVQNDDGFLFSLALIAFSNCVIITWLKRKALLEIINR